MSTNEPVVFDLSELVHGSVSRSEAEGITGRCDCGEYISQSQDICPVCGAHIVWFGSKKWRRLYGSPTEKRRRLSAITPESSLGAYLISRAGVRGFESKDDHRAWVRIERVMSRDEIMEMISSCEKKGSKRQGLIRHVINYGRKVLREREVVSKEKEQAGVIIPPKGLER